MITRRVMDLANSQGWLGKVDNALSQAIHGALEAMGPVGTGVGDFLHGTWLGHPLHPAVTDLPVGAWTTGFVLDALDAASGDDSFAPAADLALEVGLAGALISALSGMADWNRTDEPARRLGLVHGLLNFGAVAMYTASLALRSSGARPAGRAVSAVAYGTAFFSQYLGGELVFREKLGVDHSVRRNVPKDFTPVIALDELPENEPRRVRARGVSVMLVRRGDQVFAINEICSHLGGPLSEGKLEGDTITCPWHGSVFSIRDGSVVHGPAAYSVSCYETRINEGQVEIRLQQQ